MLLHGTTTRVLFRKALATELVFSLNMRTLDRLFISRQDFIMFFPLNLPSLSNNPYWRAHLTPIGVHNRYNAYRPINVYAALALGSYFYGAATTGGNQWKSIIKH